MEFANRFRYQLPLVIWLSDLRKRSEFAQRVYDDYAAVAGVYGSPNRNLFVSRLIDGMEQGRRQIVQRVTALQAQQAERFPEGLKQRLAILVGDRRELPRGDSRYIPRR
jgi:hypothetical protein